MQPRRACFVVHVVQPRRACSVVHLVQPRRECLVVHVVQHRRACFVVHVVHVVHYALLVHVVPNDDTQIIILIFEFGNQWFIFTYIARYLPPCWEPLDSLEFTPLSRTSGLDGNVFLRCLLREWWEWGCGDGERWVMGVRVWWWWALSDGSEGVVMVSIE